MSPCENCGKLESKSKLKKKPFCSILCAKTAKTSPEEIQVPNTNTDERTKCLEMKNVDSTEIEQMKVQSSVPNDVAVAKATIADIASTTDSCSNDKEQVPLISKWTVSDVCEFIRSLPGCSDYAEDFENQEIDGQALLLLKPNNLVSVMGIKLGPALKIIDRVNFMKDGHSQDE